MQLRWAGHLLLRGIGLALTNTRIGWRNLSYNLARHSFFSAGLA
jgi:hypothetical protein